MSQRLPPLNALRAFEVAARHGGFTSAARELYVTPAAVSHQIKALESHLDVQLFLRLPRGLEITEAGRQLLPPYFRFIFPASRSNVVRSACDNSVFHFLSSLISPFLLSRMEFPTV